jgi:hypothetical protein
VENLFEADGRGIAQVWIWACGPEGLVSVAFYANQHRSGPRVYPRLFNSFNSLIGVQNNSLCHFPTMRFLGVRFEVSSGGLG